MAPVGQASGRGAVLGGATRADRVCEVTWPDVVQVQGKVRGNVAGFVPILRNCGFLQNH